jgi:hypothetical protein
MSKYLVAILLLLFYSYSEAQLTKSKWDDRFASPGIHDHHDAKALVTFRQSAYLGGSFTNIGSFHSNGLAKWDGKQWQDLSANFRPTMSEKVSIEALAIDSNGILYAAGYFSFYDSLLKRQVYSLGQWDGKQWHYIGDGLPEHSYIEEMVIVNKRNIVARGSYLYEGFAKFDGKWSSLYPVRDTQAFLIRNKNRAESWHFSGDARGQHSNYFADTARIKNKDGSIVKYLYHDDDMRNLVSVGNEIYVRHSLRWRKQVPFLLRWRDSLWESIEHDSIKNISQIFSTNSLLYAVTDYSRGIGKHLSTAAIFDGQKWTFLNGTVGITFGNFYIHKNQLAIYGHLRDKSDHYAGNYAVWNGKDWIMDTTFTISLAATSDSGVVFVTDEYNGYCSLSNVLLYKDDSLYELSPQPALGVRGSLTDFTFFHDTLFVAGDCFCGGSNTLHNVGYWTGTEWHDIGESLSEASGIQYFSMRDLKSTNQFLYGVMWGNPETLKRNTEVVWQWNGSQWKQLGGNLGFIDSGGRCGDVYTLLPGENGTLYVSGDFDSVDGVYCHNVAFWNGSSWESIDNLMPGTTSNNDTHLKLKKGNDLFWMQSTIIRSKHKYSIIRSSEKKHTTIFTGKPGLSYALSTFRNTVVALEFTRYHYKEEKKRAASRIILFGNNDSHRYLPNPEKIKDKEFLQIHCDSNNLYCFISEIDKNSRIYRWDDNHWTKIGENPNVGIYTILIKEGYLYAITHSDNGEESSGFGILKLQE